ncbi:unnamed protein product [Rotaria sp. Silwood1]|nr:unnamed protein product [Rotaria sp. Silwood1]CAF3363286.1 unnamed protein product [Rotaria sp. Silwood1]CAF4670617.1 unnamed protein product [Rotaria sp. Silwood1]
MSSSDSIESAQKALLAEVTKQDFALKHVEPPAELFSTAQAKLLLEVQGGKYELHHVENPPKEGLTEAEKQAYLEAKNQAGN